MTAHAKTKSFFISTIKGNKLIYRKIAGYSPESGSPIVGGKKKSIKLGKKVKYYWFRSDNPNKHQRVSKNVFLKRTRYYYNTSNKQFERHWITGKLIKNGCQYAMVKIKKGKVTAIWAMYRP